jgi:ABC-2 type transport system ATP-binding protein
MHSIEIKDLKKTYRSKISKNEKIALKGIDLEIPQGSFFGLLGPNGAGKSTIINIIAGLVLKTSGKVIVNDFDLDKNPIDVRKSIGIVPQEVVIDPFFSVADTLEYYAGYFGVRKKDRKTAEILKALNLSDKAEVNPRRLSGGMKRRLLIAKALVHSPKILILDEPTAGVDVELRLQLWDYVKQLNKNGTTILLTTHYLEEAQELCDQIAIINHGEVVANDKTSNLLHQLDKKKIIFRFENKINEIPASLNNFSPEIIENNFALKITYNPSTSRLEDVISQINSNKLAIKDISTQEADLEDVFRNLVRL